MAGGPRVRLFPKPITGQLDVAQLSLITGWLPSEIRRQQYADMVRLIELRAEQADAQRQAVEVQRQQLEYDKWKRANGFMR